MGNVFTWMRPNDLVWNYWVNNYLMGEDPPVFDILSWNADGTNLPGSAAPAVPRHLRAQPAARHRVPWTVLGTPIDLGTHQGADLRRRRDHRPPHAVEVGCYRTTQLLGGDSTFVLSNAGHIASLVNPPGNPKASYFTGPLDNDESPDEWLEGAEQADRLVVGALGRLGHRTVRSRGAGLRAGSGPVEHPPLVAAPGQLRAPAQLRVAPRVPGAGSNVADGDPLVPAGPTAAREARMLYETYEIRRTAQRFWGQVLDVQAQALDAVPLAHRTYRSARRSPPPTSTTPCS